MIKMLRNIVLGVMISLVFSSCIDEIAGVVDGYEDLLVIEGQITNEDVAYTVLITRTSEDVNSEGKPVVGAVVSVEDSKGSKYNFVEKGRGEYVSDDDAFRGEINEQYRLNIEIKGGDTYQSSWCILHEPGDIDSIYFESYEYYSQSRMKNMRGISFYANGQGCGDDDVFLRWKCFHDWKFMVQSPTYHELFRNAPDSVVVTPFQNKFCFKSSISNSINIHSFQNTDETTYNKHYLTSMNPTEMDAFSIRHSLLVKQYSMSSDEYNFWRNIKETTQETGDIFGKQPYPVVSNIKNLTNPEKRAVGFFKVSGVSEKRIYVDRADISFLKIPVLTYTYSCPIDTFLIDSVEFDNVYEVYDYYVNGMGLGLVDLYTNLYTNEILGIRVTEPKCNDCTISGSPNVPSYWEEAE